MIKIIEEDKQLSQDRINMLEKQGLTLISVNTYTTKERAFPVEMWIPGMVTPLVDKTHWVYHFRCAERPSEGSDRRPSYVSHGSGETSL